MQPRYVIFTPELGVLVDLIDAGKELSVPGCLAQLWGNIQASSLVSAITFASETEARAVLDGQLLPGAITFLPVTADIYGDGRWRASVQSCITAGIEPWLPLAAPGMELHLRLDSMVAGKLIDSWGDADRNGYACFRTSAGLRLVFVGPDREGRPKGYGEVLNFRSQNYDRGFAYDA